MNINKNWFIAFGIVLGGLLVKFVAMQFMFSSLNTTYAGYYAVEILSFVLVLFLGIGAGYVYPEKINTPALFGALIYLLISVPINLYLYLSYLKSTEGSEGMAPEVALIIYVVAIIINSIFLLLEVLLAAYVGTIIKNDQLAKKYRQAYYY